MPEACPYISNYYRFNTYISNSYISNPNHSIQLKGIL